MLYLVGVDHSVQHDGCVRYKGPEFERLREEFPEFLIQIARQIDVKVIAEESHEDVLRKFSATKSVASVVASELGVKHLFCEPSIAEREQLGITSTGRREDFEKREKFWLEKLRDLKETPILFILGPNHMAGFSELAKNNGMSVEVAEEYYGRTYFSP
jgi:hypothetical protein